MSHGGLERTITRSLMPFGHGLGNGVALEEIGAMGSALRAVRQCGRTGDVLREPHGGASAVVEGGG